MESNIGTPSDIRQTFVTNARTELLRRKLNQTRLIKGNFVYYNNFRCYYCNQLTSCKTYLRPNLIQKKFSIFDGQHHVVHKKKSKKCMQICNHCVLSIEEMLKDDA